MTQTFSRAEPLTSYRHEAFLWQGMDSFVAHTQPFVADAVDDGMPVMVAVPADHWEPLREALGTRERAVAFVDMTALARNPARVLPAWLDFIAENSRGRRPLRGIGEPVWAGRRDAEVVEYQIHESMLNVAVPADTPLWLLCPYDVDALSQEVLDDARRSHPIVAAEPEVSAHSSYEHPREVLSIASRALSLPGGDVEEIPFARGGLAAVRRLVERHAAAAGIVGFQVGDLVLGVNEVAANSLDHGGGGGVLRAWRERDALVFEVTDSGRIADPLVGRTTPRPSQLRGRGLWMVNRLCDLVQIRTTPTGSVVRVVTWL